jgi:hypothetical protein
MIITDLDNKRVEWKLAGYLNNSRSSSELHVQARAILKAKYPTMLVLEEVTVPLKHGMVCYLDFYIPLKRLCVEVNGKQHYEFSNLFHKHKMDFLNQQKRDRDKKEWLRKNDISLIELPYNRTQDWEDMINGRTT